MRTRVSRCKFALMKVSPPAKPKKILLYAVEGVATIHDESEPRITQSLNHSVNQELQLRLANGWLLHAVETP